MQSKRYMMRIDSDIEKFINDMPGESYTKKINAILRIGICSIDFMSKQNKNIEQYKEESIKS